jgi:hypothetical protein
MNDKCLQGAGIDQEGGMNDQCLQGAGKEQEERMNYQILQDAGIDQERGMNDQCLQGVGIDLASEIDSSQMEEVYPNKFSSLLKLIRSAAWMYRFIKKTQKLTRNVSELTTEEIERAKIRWYNYELGQNCKTEIH